MKEANLVIKDRAMKNVKSKLLSLKIEEQMKKLAEIRGDVKEIGWEVTCSYVFMPYTMVKDHRTSEETGNVRKLLWTAILIILLVHI